MPDAPTDPLTAAERALDAARGAVGSAVTARAQALSEAARLRERAQAGGALAELDATAAARAAEADRLEQRIEQLRDLARRAEVAVEALRADRPGAAPADGADAPAADDERPAA
ncbi:hypothetical protein SK069_09560 [Patulibacter brassicae]|jgi:uncharacterized sporulation protein YeaH/YhbH (DUF444 family)|uniref:Uncharacterized protein n=1 Tax=Patulibacter brassicae TaxID=1705717 RepID=A0ABU4VJ23_9ACTN|nr:hypothetical protein [Patulibacter brassicae]MDX8151839.1 hypothetical protein [Patulibacter brassicae]